MISNRRVKEYCKEDPSKIENYDKAIADTTQTWHLHHRTEIWWNCSAQDLIDNECYYNRKACELIFLTPSEHQLLHMNNISDEYRNKFSKAKIGNNNAKGHVVSKEQRNNHSKLLKGKTWKVINGRRVWLDAII